MNKPPLKNGLYPITHTELLHGRLENAVRDALAGGACMIQYRDKGNDSQRRQQQATRLKNLCDEYDALLIINDDISLAQTCGAHGVHIGREDISLTDARNALGDDKIIGVSCYNQIELAISAESEGADYVAFGSFFPSSVKPDAVKADIELLRQAGSQLTVPVVAIGGITLENAASLVQAGANMLAVINGVFAQKTIQSTAQKFSNLFK